MRKSKQYTITLVGCLALASAGAASAYAVSKTIFIKPGHCTTIRKTRVCARKVAPVTVTQTHTGTVTSTMTSTVTYTVTVAPSPIGTTFSGNGDKTLAPMTLSHGVEVSWTSMPDSYGNNIFSVSSSSEDTNFVTFDNGNSSTSGTSYIPPGTYTFTVIAAGAWTLSF